MDESLEQNFLPEVLRYSHYDSIVILPYSQNIDAHLHQRLTLFSTLAVFAGAQLLENGYGKQIILCGEDTFGTEFDQQTGIRIFKSTTDLQKELLIQYCKQNSQVINQVNVPNMNNTAQQIREVAKLQRIEEKNKKGNINYLVVAWGFHENRVQSHMQGYGLIGDVITVEKILRSFKLSSDFNIDTLLKALPMNLFESREKLLRLLAKYDKQGIIPILLTLVRGASVTDVRHTKNNGVQFLNTTGRKRLQTMRRKMTLWRQNN